MGKKKKVIKENQGLWKNKLGFDPNDLGGALKMKQIHTTMYELCF